MKIKSLSLKISLIVACIIAVLITILLLVALGDIGIMINELVEGKAEVANSVLIYKIQNLQDSALTNADYLALSQPIIDSVLSGDADSLQKELRQHLHVVDIISVCDTNGDVIAWGNDDNKSDNIFNQRAVQSALKGNRISLIGKELLGTLSTQASAPVRDSDGNIIAVIVCGHDLSQTKYLEEVKAAINCEVTIFDGDKRLNTTLIDEKGNRVVGTKASDMVIETVLRQQKPFSLRIELFGSTYGANYTPMIVDGEVIGMYFAGVNIGPLLQREDSVFANTIIISIVIGVISVLLVILFCILSVRMPLKKIEHFAGRLEVGDLGLVSSSQMKIHIRTTDEIGILARAMECCGDKLRGYIGEIADRMNDLAEGDLTTESTYEFQGDFIVVKDSMNKTIRNLGNALNKVNCSAAQVSLGSRQISDGAQSLAQGATEQAASIEQLSSSVSEISQKTKHNAEMAGKAALLSETIRGNAEKGSIHMAEMISAVGNISEASHSISKVIKVIDDIAFQTNILALNAAVEAVRAGQHGKGFAVVAGEVRHLAAKSAEAAKETEEMIQNSIEKADLGSQIAGEAAASLADIVSGINESSELVRGIAMSSEEQSLGIRQVNVGIEQVSQVIQQNSATAEESAAASEEMSSQSEILGELTAQFRLKDVNASHGSLISSSIY